MKIFKTSTALMAAALSAGGLTLGLTGVSEAATNVTAVTQLHARPDSGYSGNDWANDSMTRTVTVTETGPDPAPSDCGPSATTCFAYTGTISDKGTAFALTGAISPGAQAVPIKGTPSAAITGSATVTFDSSSDAPDAALVPTSLSGDGNAEQTTTNWVEQFFPAGTTFGNGPNLPTWEWDYNDTADCQKWVDAFNGSQATSGDITGVDQCAAVPVLTHGKGIFVAPTRENVTWMQSVASWDKFSIVGPGEINGHVGWVNAVAGGVPNVGSYSGLLAHHGYTVTFTPYTAKNGTPIAGAKPGVLYFVS
jgi:hypothetical protein